MNLEKGLTKILLEFTTDEILQKISSYKKDGLHVSVDLYYNDLEPEFVAKLSNLDFDRAYPDLHFRGDSLHKVSASALLYLQQMFNLPK